MSPACRFLKFFSASPVVPIAPRYCSLGKTGPVNGRRPKMASATDTHLRRRRVGQVTPISPSPATRLTVPFVAIPLRFRGTRDVPRTRNDFSRERAFSVSVGVGFREKNICVCSRKFIPEPLSPRSLPKIGSAIFVRTQCRFEYATRTE